MPPISMDNPERKINADFSVLYSGGLDSTAVALMMGKKFTGRIHLMTIHHNFGNLFPRWSEKHADDLKRIYGDDRVLHSIVNITDEFKKITYDDLKSNLRNYGHFTWCLGCILSLVARILVNNLIHKVPYAFICSSVGGEYAVMSMPVAIEAMRRICREYGVDYRAPLLELNIRKPQERKMLEQENIWPGLKVLKGVQGVQPICLPGFQHILDNLFDIHTNPVPEKVEAFLMDRKEVIRKIIEQYFAKQNLDLQAHIDALKAHLAEIESI